MEPGLVIGFQLTKEFFVLLPPTGSVTSFTVGCPGVRSKHVTYFMVD